VILLWRTLHDSRLSCPGIHIILQPALALADTPVCAILPTGASSAFTSWHNRLSAKIRHDLFCPVIQVQSSPQPPYSRHSPPHTIAKTHSKHIVPSGGFAQPTLSLVLRREDLRNPSQHVGLSTSDRVLVGLPPINSPFTGQPVECRHTITLLLTTKAPGMVSV
jgi:hypothetical protein